MGVLRSRLSNQIACVFRAKYLLNEVWDEIDFLYADKYQRFAQVQLFFTSYML